MSKLKNEGGRWYEGITRYQWLVFAIACLGWIFDVFEGQIFAVFKTPAMADLLGGLSSSYKSPRGTGVGVGVSVGSGVGVGVGVGVIPLGHSA